MVRPGMVEIRAALRVLGICVLTVAGSAGQALGQSNGDDPVDGALGESQPVDKVRAIHQFRAEHPGCDFMYLGARIDRVYGRAFARGQSAQQSAEAFRARHAAIWGVGPSDLIPVGPFQDGRHLQPIMFDRTTGQYKFTGVYYTQVRDAVPVFRGRVMMLTRNEPDFPLVLASADLRDIGNFRVDAAAAGKVNAAAGFAAVRAVMPKGADVVAGSTVIWAGVDAQIAPPTLAVQFIAEAGNGMDGTYQKVLFLTDAATGDILYQESQVHDVDVVGNVSGMATQGNGADTCGPEAIVGLPYAEVSIGANPPVYADINGDFVIPNSGSSPVTVTSPVSGRYFIVDSISQPDSVVTQNVTPPGPANIVHNQANSSEFMRAEVNAYLHANIVRDFVLAQNPDYPVISDQVDFPVNVNINLSCNAFYNGTSINFYVAGIGPPPNNNTCTNTANSTIVHHEYGHHVVQTGGSGQSSYGEGMGDVMGVLITGDPCLGSGFNGPCGSCLRNADNTCSYSTSVCSTGASPNGQTGCGASPGHGCGQLISGCVWSTRNELAMTEPADYEAIIASLAINSVLLHNGGTITPSITVDYLTLDDDNDDIGDGTPHYEEINAGFSAHNMPAPPLAPLKFIYPNGRPSHVTPAGGTVLRFEVQSNVQPESPQPGTGQFFVDTGSGFSVGTVNEVSPNIYDAVFPASVCGETVRYYLSAQTETAQTVTSPSAAPSTWFEATSAVSAGPVLFADDFESDLGWTVTVQGATAGIWERGEPAGDGDRGDPMIDADASGQCYLTGNADGDTDVDNGATTLVSPIMDAMHDRPVLSYWRWYSNTFGASPENDTFVVEFSINGGASWNQLETVGPNSASENPEVDGGWFFKSFNLASVPGFSPTSEFRVRFTAQDLGMGSVIEAGVDGVRVDSLICQSPCPSDINGDGMVNVTDLLAVIGAWGPCGAPCPEDVNGNGTVNVQDLLIVIGDWGDCP